MTTHLTEDDLVLHFYGEMDTASESQAVSHLAECDACRRSYTRLQRVLAAVDAMPAPALDEGFERVVWARLEPARAESPAVYRAGVRFSDADPRALMTFISQHSAAEVAS